MEYILMQRCFMVAVGDFMCVCVCMHAMKKAGKIINISIFLNGRTRIYFLKFSFIYFNWRLITLQYCIGSATHQHESTTVYTCSPSWTTLPPLSRYHPSGSSQCTSPKDPVSKLDWLFISYMILYMFPCHSPKSSHPLPLPRSTKDCYIHLCLFCCLAYRVIITIFLNSIYMR